jgi:hypothetical protein
VIQTVPQTSAFVEVPGDPATLQVSVANTRANPGVLSTSVAVTWTFTSAHTTQAEDLPLSVFRFTPPLDGNNSAPSGSRLFAVPFRVDHQGRPRTQRGTPSRRR